MSDSTSKTMLRPYIQAAPAPLFLSGFFKSPPENFHATEAVEIDIQRDGEDVAVAITGGLAAGGNYNANNIGSNKEFKPPVFKERVSIAAHKLIDRDMGDNPYASTPFRAKALIRTARASAKVERKIRRAIELQASQILQTGTITHVNEDGVNVFTLDFQGKTSHFDTVDATWSTDGSTGAPLSDLEGMADRIRSDGLTEPDTLVCGKSALLRMLANSRVEKALTRDGIGLGQLNPSKRGNGATFYGFLWVGPYRFELWTYSGGYIHPQTKERTPYVEDDHIIMLSSQARLDLTYGDIPAFAPPEQRVMQFLPRRVSDSERGVDMALAAWLEPDGSSLTLQVGARPLCIPTEIDSFGCLDVVAS